MESDLQILAEADEAAESGLIYQASLQTMFKDLGRFHADRCTKNSSREGRRNLQFPRQVEVTVACLEEYSIVNGHDFDCFASFWQHLKSSNKDPELQENHTPKQQPASEEHRPSAAFQPNETVDRCSLRILSPYVSSVQVYAPPVLLDTYAQPRDHNPSRKKVPINSRLLDVLICSCTTKILMRYAMNTDAPHMPDMHKWLEKVLEYRGKDEAVTGIDEPYETSDGALDSHDSVRTGSAL